MNETVPCVINSVLCFISSSLNSYEKEVIIHQAVGFYSENDIKNAKSTICNHLKIKPAWRRSDDKMRNEVKDIIDLVNQANADGTLPKYVADYYRAFPPLYGYEIIANDIKSLRNEVLDVKETIKETSSTCQCSRSNSPAEIETIKEEIIEIKQFMKDIISSKKHKDIECNGNNGVANCSFVSSASEHLSLIPGLSPTAPPYSQAPVSPLLLNEDKVENLAENDSTKIPSKHENNDSKILNTGTKEKQTYSKALINNRKNMEKVAKNIPKPKVLSLSNKEKDQTQSTPSVTRTEGKYQYDDEGFKMKIKKPKIVGKNQNNSRLKAIKRTKVLYIGRMEEQTTAEDIENYIKEDIGVDILKCYKLNCSMRQCSSFKVIVNASEFDALLSETAWPIGAIVHEFIYRNPYEQNVDHDD